MSSPAMLTNPCEAKLATEFTGMVVAVDEVMPPVPTLVVLLLYSVPPLSVNVPVPTVCAAVESDPHAVPAPRLNPAYSMPDLAMKKASPDWLRPAPPAALLLLR